MAIELGEFCGEKFYFLTTSAKRNIIQGFVYWGKYEQYRVARVKFAHFSTGAKISYFMVDSRFNEYLFLFMMKMARMGKLDNFFLDHKHSSTDIFSRRFLDFMLMALNKSRGAILNQVQEFVGHFE